VLAFNLSFWYLASFFTDTLDSRLVRWLGLVIAAGIPSNAERFFRAFVAEDPKSPLPLSRHVWIGTVAAGIGLVIGLFFPIADRLWFTIPFFLFIFGSLGYCVYLLAQRQRSHPNRSTATRLQFLLYGGAATVFLAATDFLPHIGLPFPTLGNVLTVIYLYFISQTLFHYRLLDIKELLAKMVSLAALVLILSSIYGLLLAWVGPKQSGLFFFNTIVASFVILVIFEPLRGLIEERVNRWLFAEKYEFSRRLRVLARTLANIIEVRPLVSQLLSDLEATGRVTHVSVYLADPSGASYHLAGHVGPRPVDSWDRNARRLFFDRLHREGLLTREVMERERAEAETEEASVSATNVLTTMEAMLADVCIPLLSDGKLLGLLALRDDRLREAYASEELELLKQVAIQAALTLRNSKSYEVMKERERLAALGQMAAGLAHEIRNPLGAIKGAAQLIRTSGSEAGGAQNEDAQFLAVIVEEVNRLDQVVSQFLGYARPDRGERQRLMINEVVRKTLQLLASQTADDELEIESTLASELPEVRGDPEQLLQVFLNLALNAIQAMTSPGKLTIATRLRPAYRESYAARLVEVSFADNGPGIDPEVLPDIFIPFFTTKERGTGLGLPICQRIVESHHGLIEVQSEPQKGATFSVVLPVADEVDATGTHTLSL
jgi:two-component system sensor histidine kinase HydH